MDDAIPFVDIQTLFGGPTPQREQTDRAIMAAAADSGFLLVGGLAANVPIDRPSRAALLSIFQLPEAEIRKLWRQKFAPAHANVYRGWFPLQRGFATSKEGIDLGADLAYGPAVVRNDDPLREATPLPPPEALPGWREAAAAYYRAMETVSGALMRALARGLGLPERHFDAAFERGLSTLRLIRYPVRTDLEQAAASDPSVWVSHAGARRHLTGVAHVDSGFLTLLAQDGVGGLQARHRDGHWVDVPPTEGALAVNFGKVLERWCGGRIKATEHRVVGSSAQRMSIPFFYEACAEAEIGPLPIPGAAAFEPFLYGDYLWATTTQFVEFHGLETMRKPLRPVTVASDDRAQRTPS